MHYYEFDVFCKDINRFCNMMGEYKPDIILAIARGGVTFGHFLSEKLNLRRLYTLNSIHYNDTIKRDTVHLYNIPIIPPNTNVLVVDDIVDSGETMHEILTMLKNRYPESRFKTGVLFYKEDAKFTPDFKVNKTDEWIHFFWNINS